MANSTGIGAPAATDAGIGTATGALTDDHRLVILISGHVLSPTG